MVSLAAEKWTAETTDTTSGFRVHLSSPTRQQLPCSLSQQSRHHVHVRELFRGELHLTRQLRLINPQAPTGTISAVLTR